MGHMGEPYVSLQCILATTPLEECPFLVIHTIIQLTEVSWYPRCDSHFSVDHHFIWIVLQVTTEVIPVKRNRTNRASICL